MSDRVVAGRYRLISPLGRGGMAVVWRAKDEVLGRDVAVKLVDLTGPDSQAWGARFEREARTTAMLNHPSIVTVFDTGVEDSTAYLVMELLPGPTLADRLRAEGPLPVEDVRSIGIQMSAALTAAHEAGVVHRDIKPANVSYAADGTVKVLDFGITQLLDDPSGHGLTRTNTVMGTADYLAPEQATGSRVDARADLYALGCVLFALLTGQSPFHAETPVATMLRHTQEPVPDIRLARPDVGEDMATVVDRLLQKSPDDRPQTAEEVSEALRGIRPMAAASTQVLPTGTEVLQPATPEPAGPTPVPVQPRKRGIWAWLPWVLLGALVVAVIVYVVTNPSRQDQPPATTTTSSPAVTVTAPTTATTTHTTTPTSTTPTSTSPTSTTTTETTKTTTTALSPQVASDNLRTAVDEGVSAKEIDKTAEGSLGKKLDAIDTAIGQGKTQAQAAVDDFGTTVEQLVSAKHINEAGAEHLDQPYKALQNAVAGM